MKKKLTVMQKLKYYGQICCASFTLVELTLSLLNVMLEPMSSNLWLNNLELFLVCLGICLLMFLTDLKTGVSEMEGHIGVVNILIHLLDVAIPVLGLGGTVFHWFDLTSPEILVPIGILVFVYFAIYGVSLLYSMTLARNINKKILERKEERNHGKENH